MKERQYAGSHPGTKSLIFGKFIGQRFDTPVFKINVRVRNQCRSRTHIDVLARGREAGPTNGSEEADSVILKTVSLQITGDQFFILTFLESALRLLKRMNNAPNGFAVL